MFKESKQLHDERAKLIEQSRNILQVAEDAKRELTTEETTNYDKYLDDIERKSDEITRVERTAKLTAENEQKLVNEATERELDQEEVLTEKEQESRAFENYLRLGEKKMEARDLEILSKRAQSLGTDSEGGYLAPNEFAGNLEEALQAHGGVREVAEIITTGTGQTFEWPTVDGTSNTGEWIAENAAVAEQDETFAETTWSAYILSSKVTKVSRVILNDSFIDLASFMGSSHGTRLARGANTAYTTGNGSSKPTGIVHGAAIGKTGASSTAVTFDELKDTWAALDSAYDSNAKWMFSKATLNSISKLKDGDNQYLWQPNNQAGQADRLLGFEYQLNEDMPAIAAGNRSILFGDFSKYKIRDVQGITMLRLEELYAANLQVGFISFLRTDGKTLNAGGDPFVCLRQPST
jgi:HK97 family phage major capsid protein